MANQFSMAGQPTGKPLAQRVLKMGMPSKVQRIRDAETVKPLGHQEMLVVIIDMGGKSPKADRIDH